MRHATLVISQLEDRRSPLVSPIDDIETGTVMFNMLAILISPLSTSRSYLPLN